MFSMPMTKEALAELAGADAQNLNFNAVFLGLVEMGSATGLTLPHRLVPFLAQISHESNAFRYDREIWGPTAAQVRYDTRTDLGNSPEKDGDGKLYMGRTAMQITGKSNTTAFRDWCRKHAKQAVPDFVKQPELMNTDPWEGLGPIWFWSANSLNTYADAGDFQGLTKRINGGLNGYSDRCKRFTEIGLRALGYQADDVRKFQKDVGLVVDGIAGPATRSRIHYKLIDKPSVEFVNLVQAPDTLQLGSAVAQSLSLAGSALLSFLRILKGNR